MSHSLFASYFAEKLRMSPSLGSYLGDRRRDSHVEDALSPTMLDAAYQLCRKYDMLLHSKKEKGHTLSIEDLTLAWEVKMGLESRQYPLEQLAMNSFRNVVIDMAFNESQIYPKPSESRYHDYITILRTTIANMKAGLHNKVVLPKCICEKLLASLRVFIASSSVIKGTEGVIMEMIEFLEKEYLPACRQTIGLCDLPKGKAMYRHLIRFQTSTNMTPEAIHAYGIKEVARIEAAFRRVQQVLGRSSKEPLSHFYHWAMNRRDQYCSNDAEVIKMYKATQKRIRETIWKENFDYVLKMDYHIKKVAKEMEDTSAGAFYMPSSYKAGGFEGTFYVNMRDLKENPKYNMYTLGLHEGFHHYQYQYMIENKIPSYMIYGVSNNAYSEGIALYAEGLGVYTDPMEEFGHLVNDIMRAARLVVDTGIHWYGWSWKKTLDYMLEHIPLSHTEIETELERYICYPAQALCYSIGRKVFTELRDAYLKKNPGDIKGYHHSILENGVLPLDVLKEKIYSSI
jgi:uncharacterized protein (DUF885 family)